MIQSVPKDLPVTNVTVAGPEPRSPRLETSSSSIPSSRLRVSVLQGGEQERTVQDSPKSSLEDPQKINRLLEQVRESLKKLDPRVELSLDTELNTVIVRVLDKETGDLEKQFPPEDLLELKRFLSDHSGLFVQEEA
ncbi:MAG: flagellar protein FlaG [Nitrospirales bacterium]